MTIKSYIETNKCEFVHIKRGAKVFLANREEAKTIFGYAEILKTTSKNNGFPILWVA